MRTRPWSNAVGAVLGLVLCLAPGGAVAQCFCHKVIGGVTVVCSPYTTTDIGPPIDSQYVAFNPCLLPAAVARRAPGAHASSAALQIGILLARGATEVLPLSFAGLAGKAPTHGYALLAGAADDGLIPDRAPAVRVEQASAVSQKRVIAVKPRGSDSVRVELRSGHAVVGTLVSGAWGAVATMGDWPTGFTVTPGPGTAVSYTWIFAPGTSATLAGHPATHGDRLTLTVPGMPPDSLAPVLFQASGFQRLTLGPGAHRVPPKVARAPRMPQAMAR